MTWCQPSRCTPHLQRIREGDFEDLSFHHITQNKFLVDKKKTRCPNQKVLRKELPVGACTFNIRPYHKECFTFQIHVLLLLEVNSLDASLRTA